MAEVQSMVGQWASNSPPAERERILVVDDDQGLLHLLNLRLTAMGFAVTTCTSTKETISLARREVFDLAITDLRLGEEDGLAVMEELLRIHPSLPIIILTAYGSIPNAVQAIQKGAYGYLTKPFDDQALKLQIEKALAEQRMGQEIQRLKLLVKELYGIENVVARSSQMQTLLQQVAHVAETDATICLTGETGTGKEVIARVIHCNSRRAHGRFVAVNCNAIPEHLFESELFGHVKGAFTGAYESKIGLFQSANGGTLFLDEIGDLPLSLQAKLLRTLQEREALAVGATQPRKVDARIIAATNKDLEHAVKTGSFREDLYYRIQVVPFKVPPLRERRDDIPLLAQHSLKQSCQRMQKVVRGFQPEALQKLMLHAWPGNVRELENVIEKAVILTTTDFITADLILSEKVVPACLLPPLAEARAEFERSYLKELLQVTGGNISRAAKIAKRYRADLYKLLKKYGLYPAHNKATQDSPTDRPKQPDEF